MLKNSQVYLSKKAQRDITMIPKRCRDKLECWILTVSQVGIDEVGKMKGFMIESQSKGDECHHSIALNKVHKAVYVNRKQFGYVEILKIEEVN